MLDTHTPVIPVRSDDTPLRLVTRTPLLNGARVGGDAEAMREELRAYFHATFSLYESIFECLASEDSFVQRANPLRHPLIFYYGHTAVFFVNKLVVSKLIQQRVDPALESILAIGVDEMSWDDLDDTRYEWPRVETVRAYRAKVRALVDQVISDMTLTLPIQWDDPAWVVLMGIEHERIHLETTSVLIRELPLAQVRPHALWGAICEERGEPPKNRLLDVDGGRVVVGRARDSAACAVPVYGWDNEFGRTEVDVPAFRASANLVTNREFQAFVEDGGYTTRDWWSDEGWSWVTFREATRPVFWVERQGALRYRAMLAETDMPWDWPAEVNYLEAKAFCRWESARTGRTIRLPSEAEWHRLRALVETDQPLWETAPGNINLEGPMSPTPVTRHQFAGGFTDLIGNVWQWTETPIYPLEGFEVHPAYDDFSVPTFDAKHHLFKGGCWISTGNYAIEGARYAFRRHFFQHAGLRYVEAGPLPEPEATLSTSAGRFDAKERVYETLQQGAEFAELHYGPDHLGVPNLPRTCAQLAIQHLGDRPRQRALEVGCGSGRAAFELATTFAHVDALDLSTRLLQAPVALQREGRFQYEVTDEGALTIQRVVTLDALGYAASKDRVTFQQADACNLHQKYAGYDLILSINLLDRLYNPAAFLQEIKHRLNPGGLLVLASPYNWSEEHTPRDAWLGGDLDDDGAEVRALHRIQSLLAPELSQEGPCRDVDFVIRKTSRVFTHGQAQLSMWRRVR